MVIKRSCIASAVEKIKAAMHPTVERFGWNSAEGDTRGLSQMNKFSVNILQWKSMAKRKSTDILR